MQLNGAHCHLECVSNIEVQLVVKAMHLQSFPAVFNECIFRLCRHMLHFWLYSQPVFSNISRHFTRYWKSSQNFQHFLSHNWVLHDIISHLYIKRTDSPCQPNIIHGSFIDAITFFLEIRKKKKIHRHKKIEIARHSWNFCNKTMYID